MNFCVDGYSDKQQDATKKTATNISKNVEDLSRSIHFRISVDKDEAWKTQTNLRTESVGIILYFPVMLLQ